MMQDRRALIRLQRQLVEPAAGKLAQSLKVRREMPQRLRVEIERQQIAQRPVHGPEVEPTAIGRDQVGAGRSDRRSNGSGEVP